MESTRITGVNVFTMKLELNSKYENSLGVKDRVGSVLLYLKTDSDVIGFSSIEPDSPSYSEETFYNIKSTVENEFVPLIKGQDPMDTAAIMNRIGKSVYGHYMSKSLVESALLDLKGKILRLSVLNMLGGPVRDNLKVIGWVGIGRIEDISNQIEKTLSDGFSTIKLKIGPEVEKNSSILSAIRKDFGYDFSIRVDANQSMNRSSAMKFIERAAHFELDLIEQPVNRMDIDSMAFLSKRSFIPIMADESAVTRQDILHLIQREAASIVKLKVMRNGGVSETLKMIAVAEAGGIDCIIGNGFSSSVGTQIEATVALASPSLSKEHEFVGPLKLKYDVVKEKSEYIRNVLKFRKGPGFGYDSEDLTKTVRSSIV
ncbi:MAG: mandelate racemase/muconate lactonizing enzyme family protein [Thermoplasmata archaeon]